MDANACAQSPWPSFYVALLIAYSLLEYKLGKRGGNGKAGSVPELALQLCLLIGAVVLTACLKIKNKGDKNYER